ncbi:MAG: dual specificity protein phosphatase family protein [Thermoplasmata archaeon]
MPTNRAPKSPRPKSRTATPSEIAPGVYVGGWKDALKFDGTRFCVLEEAPPDMPAATHIAIYDEATDRADVANLDRLAKTMISARARGEPVLVFCGHGVRRSPLGAAWYLRRAERISLDAAYERVRSVRPRVEHARDWVGNAADLERA